jgi:putative tricarboxylic transport membrane protein
MRRDLVGGVVGVALGAGVVAGAVGLRVGTPTSPEPGFFPLLGGLGVAVMAGVLLVQAALGRSTGGEAFGELRRPAILVGALAIYVAILEPVGYVIATLAIAGVMLRVLGVHSWRVLVTGSVGLAGATWLLFARLLGIDLPAGLLAP